MDTKEYEVVWKSKTRKCFGVGPTDRPKISRNGLAELATSTYATLTFSTVS